MDSIRAEFSSLTDSGSRDLTDNLSILRNLMEKCVHVLNLHKEFVVLSATDHLFLEKLAKMFASLCLARYGDESIVSTLSCSDTGISCNASAVPRSDRLASVESAWDVVVLWLVDPVLCAKLQNSLTVYFALYLQKDHLSGPEGSKSARVQNVENLRRFCSYFVLDKVAATAFLLSKLSAKVQGRQMNKEGAVGKPWFSIVLSETITRILGEQNGVESVLNAIHSGINRQELDHWNTRGRLSRLSTAVPPDFRSRTSAWHRLIIPQLLHLSRTSVNLFPKLSLHRITLEAFSFILQANPAESSPLLDELAFHSLVSISGNLRDGSSVFEQAVGEALRTMDDDAVCDDLSFLARLLSSGSSPLTESMTNLYVEMGNGLAFLMFQTGLAVDLGVKDVLIELISMILCHVQDDKRESQLVDWYASGGKAVLRSLSVRSGDKILTDDEIAAAVRDLHEKASDAWTNICGFDNTVPNHTTASLSVPRLMTVIASRLNTLCRDLSVFRNIPPTESVFMEFLSLSILFRNLCEHLLDSEDDRQLQNLSESQSFWDIFLVLPGRIRTILSTMAAEQFRGIPFAVLILLMKIVGKIICLNGSQRAVDQHAVGMFFDLCLNVEGLKPHFMELKESVSWKELADGMELMVAACKLSLGMPIFSSQNDLSPFQDALQSTKDPLLPVRAHGYHKIRTMILSGDQEALSNNRTVFRHCCQALQEESDSFVYFAVIRCLETVTLQNSPEMLPALLSELASFASSEHFPVNITPEPCVRAFLVEALVRIVKGLGPASGRYSEKLLNTMLFLARDKDPEVRASAISALSDICKALRFGILPIRMELVHCLTRVMETDDDVYCRMAAVFSLYELIVRLGKDFLNVLGDCAKLVWAALRRAREAEDEMVKRHAERAIALLNELPGKMLGDENGFIRVVSERRLKTL